MHLLHIHMLPIIKRAPAAYAYVAVWAWVVRHMARWRLS